MRHSLTIAIFLPLLVACDPNKYYRPPPPYDASVPTPIVPSPPLPSGIDALPPPVDASTVGEVLRPACSVDSQCVSPSACLVGFCKSGLCSARARDCSDSDPATIDVCVDVVGCENRAEPPVTAVESCKGLKKEIVCGEDGVNYLNPCSAHNSAVKQYATAPCRLVNTYCSDNTASCVLGTRCVNHVCVR